MSEPEPIDPATIDWDRELARQRDAGSGATRECPWCKSGIPAGARACRYCGKVSSPSPDSPEGLEDAAKQSTETRKVALGCLGLVVVIAIVAAVISSNPARETWTDFDESRHKDAKEDYVYALTRDRPPEEIREKKSWLDFLAEKKRKAGK